MSYSTPKTTEIDYNEQETALFGRLVNDFNLRKDQATAALRTLSPTEITKRLYQIKLQVTDGKVSNLGAYTAERLGVK